MIAYYSYESLPKKEALMRIRAAAIKAPELDDNLAEAHMACGGLRNVSDGGWRAVLKFYRRAIK